MKGAKRTRLDILFPLAWGSPSRKQLLVSRHWRRWSLSPASPTHPHRYTPHMHTAHMSPYTSTHYIYTCPTQFTKLHKYI